LFEVQVALKLANRPFTADQGLENADSHRMGKCTKELGLERLQVL
jgi:hypothetical protein